LPPAGTEAIPQAVHGDLDEMVKRRLVRIGVTFNRTFYFIDKGMQRGVSYEYAQARRGTAEQVQEDRYRQQGARGRRATARDHTAAGARRRQGRPGGGAGHGDARLQEVVDFTNPTRMNVSQIIVTGAASRRSPRSRPCSGSEVFVRESAVTVRACSRSTSVQGRGQAARGDSHRAENLEDDDLLEMVNAGPDPAIVVDDYLAKFWKKVFRT
jgi:membrane-bound lytic murein transglycosylase MltF